MTLILTSNAVLVCLRDLKQSEAYIHIPGYSITPTELAAQVSAYITSSAASGWANLGAVIGGLKNSPETRWASPLEVKNAVETAFLEKFGTKTAAPPKGKVRCPFPLSI